MTSAITSGVSLQPFHVNLFFGEWENSLLLGRLSLEIRLFSGRAGGFGDHFHPSIFHCIFMCIVGSENMLLFSVPKIKQEYFHNNRYPTILSVVYITTFLCIVCICLTTSQSEDSEFLALLCTRHGRTSTACSTPLKCTSPGRFKRSPKRNAFAECPRCSSS